MKLTQQAISLFHRNNRLRSLLALELDVSAASINRYLDDNENNGRLTTVRAVQVISQETGLSEEEILEESVVTQN